MNNVIPRLLQELPDINRLAASIEETLHWLSEYGADGGGGITRFLYSNSWKQAQTALNDRMQQAGLKVYFDEVGNLYGRIEGTEPNRGTILTGSHIDTVINGGKYDGAFGIAAGLAALQFLLERYGRPKCNLEIVSFCEEEGSRFPLTYWGSGNVSGRYSVDQVPEICDSEGVSLREAMMSAGFGSKAGRAAKRDDIQAFIELHIEQGKVLEREEKGIGVVKGIVGQRRFTCEVTGEANHAGTTPMALRRDALAGVSEMVQLLEGLAQSYGSPMVATVGSLEVIPGLSNVIPGKVTFTLDVRHSESMELSAFCQAVKISFEEVAARRGLMLALSQWMNAEPVMMDVELTRMVEHICMHRNLSFLSMFSGAGHDTQVMQSVCPTALVFVPSRGGISHSPDEYTSTKELAAGVSVLTDFLYVLAYDRGERFENVS
ncbi:allantoate deiminase [Paenibacillus sp. FSL R10-2782]|uniref:allantoate deiminase n=1 Tax=Paenibacillus sp. FSL R10-2782 TaxID=2954661 RepID=UPI003159623A